MNKKVIFLRCNTFLFHHRILLLINNLWWRILLYPLETVYPFSLSESVWQKASLCRMKVCWNSCKENGRIWFSLRWRWVFTCVKSCCHQCETTVSHWWSNSAYRKFEGIRIVSFVAPDLGFIPSYDTFNRFFSIIKFDYFELIFHNQWEHEGNAWLYKMISLYVCVS